MSNREIVALGTSSQVPTKARNHVSTLVRLGDVTVMVDCGEGTQRQMQHAGARTSQLDLLCLTHEHGDHTFGVPGVLQRRRLDGATDPLPVIAPEAAIPRLQLLTDFATAGPDPLHRWVPAPASDEPVEVMRLRRWSIRTASLRHRVPTVGYRFVEDDGRRVLPEMCAGKGVAGPEIGRLQQGEVIRGITIEDVSVPKQGQKIAVVMDTAVCDAAVALARDCDVLVCEATYLDAERDLAAEHLHLTARQAAEVALRANVRRLVLTHLSSRYDTLEGHEREVLAVHRDAVVASDLDVVPFT